MAPSNFHVFKGKARETQSGHPVEGHTCSCLQGLELWVSIQPFLLMTGLSTQGGVPDTCLHSRTAVLN